MNRLQLERINQHRRRFHLKPYLTFAQCLADDGVAKFQAFKTIKKELEELADFNYERAESGQKLATCINEMKILQREEKSK